MVGEHGHMRADLVLEKLRVLHPDLLTAGSPGLDMGFEISKPKSLPLGMYFLYKSTPTTIKLHFLNLSNNATPW